MSNIQSMPIQFGMPTLIESPSLLRSLNLCAELGLDFVELNMNLPEYQIENIEASSASKMLAETGKYLSIHLDENLNVCDFNTAVAEAYINTVLKTIEFAKNVNAPIINMHMSDGVYFTLPGKKVYLFERYMERYLDRLRFYRDACDKAIGESDIAICIENCGEYRSFQKQGINELLESKHFALTYDIGHDFYTGNSNELFILERFDKLKHMHIHDVAGNNLHLPLGDGDVDILGKLRLAQKTGCRCVLEAKTIEGLKKSVDYLDEIIRYMDEHADAELSTVEDI